MRIKRLPYIPKSINFSNLTPSQQHELYEESDWKTEEEQDRDIAIDNEILLLRSLTKLSSDKERCVLLLEILREYGYQLDYTSIAKSLGIQLRWFMRVKRTVRKKVQAITTNGNGNSHTT